MSETKSWIVRMGFPRVKVCGVTRPEDAARAVALGAGLIGVNFYSGSPRCVDVGQAREVAAAVDGRAGLVGVFVDAPLGRVEETLAAVGLDLVQLHGDEPDETVARFGARALRVVRVEGGPHPVVPSVSEGPGWGERATPLPTAAVAAAHPSGSAALPSSSLANPSPDPSGTPRHRRAGLPPRPDSCWGLLVDLRLPHTFGGAGVAWDWGLAAPRIAAVGPVPTFIAGGIRPETARRALAASGATGVDVCSGVESSPGVKDPDLLERLMAEILA